MIETPASSDRGLTLRHSIMTSLRRRARLGIVVLSVFTAPLAAQQPPPAAPVLDVTYIPTPQAVVTAMLQLARVGKDDVVYDLGSGDGRVAIAAVTEFGAARGVGVDLDPARTREATENARRAGVAGRVSFRTENLFDTDFRDGTVLFLYLSVAINQKLRPRMLADLQPGARIVSHVFDMGSDWTPAETRIVNGRPIHLWTIQPRP
jgi:SAM-dependent methyltransferase